MPSEIALPFRLNASGQIASTDIPDEQIRQHVMSLINTEPGQRVMMGDYGVPLTSMLFEEDDDALTQELGDLIQAAFTKWEAGVTVSHVAQDAENPWDGLVKIDVGYQRVDGPASTTDERNTNVAIIRVGGSVSEVVRG